MTEFSHLMSLPKPAVPRESARAISDHHDRSLREAAQKLETTFLSEMLKAAGFGKARSAFGGGVGEEQFASLLRQAQAEEMVKAGGIGLAESLFQVLKEKHDEF